MKKTHGLDDREMELVKLVGLSHRRHSDETEKAVCRNYRADARS